MEIVGIGATVIVAAAVLIGVVVGIRSVPDLRRYVRMRRM
ncbi:DUF6893 family small protein [Smaragdicoccus niigatensis]